MTMYIYKFLIAFFISAPFWSCEGGGRSDEQPVQAGTIQITAFRVGSLNLLTSGSTQKVPTNQPIVISFTNVLDLSTTHDNIVLTNSSGSVVATTFSYLDEKKTISIAPNVPLSMDTEYTVELKNGLKGNNGEFFDGFEKTFQTLNLPLEVVEASIQNMTVTSHVRIVTNLNPEITVRFTDTIRPEDVLNKVSISKLRANASDIKPEIQSVDEFTLKFTMGTELEHYSKYKFYLSSNISVKNKVFGGFEFLFNTQLNTNDKFPRITDEELLTKIQRQTFKYFWDFAHPVSGLTRERNASGNVVTTGGSGFGVMSIIVGIERQFITRRQGVQRWTTIIDFLTNKAERLHGIWSHWLNGKTGTTIPFSTKDDGADLVESAFLMQGLLTVRQYLNKDDTTENTLIKNIDTLWKEMEWDWHRKNNQNVLYWHWSTNYGWEMNHRISGWNEALIVYVLAASSTTHTIPVEVYEQGWARSGAMRNSNEQYGITTPVGNALGSPLFFAHYSFLGLDPRNLSDQYANYWTQNVAHSTIHFNYCVANPSNYIGYSENVWGLTASDSYKGYAAHSPHNDLGVITPTAAISSLPYTPEQSMKAIRYFYYVLGDKLWGEYGFYDAFSATEGWYADSYLAIDQGPIICMIENYRTQLLWDLFMSAPEIQAGLTKLKFSY